MAEGNPQITIHDVATTEVGDHAIDGGWYEITATTDAGPVTTQGAYMLLAQRGTDGAWKIHWMVANGRPVPTMP
jgi:ketosteroid isomerase-like protein